MKTKKLSLKKLKKLKKQCWELCRKIVALRAKGKCELCEKKGEQVDHCFSRRIRGLFFDPRNLSLLCKSCHFKKSYCISGYEKLVDDIVRQREGRSWWGMAGVIAGRTVQRNAKLTAEDLGTLKKFLELKLKRILERENA